METGIIMARISVFIASFLLVGSWKCPTSKCVVFPLSLKLWIRQTEVSARSVRVKTGSDFSVTCDGSCVDSDTNPHLRWYGPDKFWIANEGGHNRIHVEKSFSRRFLKLHILNAQQGDSGLYTCRGWLGSERGWDTTSIRVHVEEEAVPRRRIPIVPIHVTSTTRRPYRITTNAQTAERIVSTTAITTESSCLPPMFQCGSGECFQDSYRCDTFPDCADGSDESSCASQTCTEELIACTDGNGCVPTDQICDGIRQCHDASDENPDVCNNQ